MEAISPVFAALGVIEFDALNDLAFWLDGRSEPMGTSDKSGWFGRAGDEPLRASVLEA
jgi:hypothetical protein